MRVAITDMIVITWAVVGTQIAWFGTLDSSLNIEKYRGGFGLSYTLISIILIASWVVVLAAFATRDVRVIGIGPTEYKRVVDATVRLFGVVAIVAFLFQLDLARGYILMSLPVGVLALLASRWIWRQWLSGQRERGLYSSRVLLLGTRDSVAAIARDLARAPYAGYLVVAACVPGDTFGGTLRGGIPVQNNLDDIQAIMKQNGADTVVVTSSDELPPERIRELSWSLEPGRQHLVLVPSLTDVGGPRIHMRPVAGLPLIHVETPSYEGLKRFSKRTFDIAASALLLLILSPVLVIIGMCVRLSTPGQVFFRQRRVGLDGKQFEMLKFRSMAMDAEQRLDEVRPFQTIEGNAVMFKMKNDPRVTPVGAFLRRFSLDELPQLFNVLSGSMSLVGPRPPLEREVQEYENHVHRRFLVKPGITGLWQVSGRSNLSWEDSVRLDLYYVENWSMTGDFVILWRTLKAVVARDGAY
ncbi:sugar transferase [Glaciihabitans sp. dw_435]|uniref:sugar transferase n=1 Tax=Glaciihabitans sp. dw_435 TaxID=2720081 RepID=UPI001BD4F1DA|nr:sugar transferase [Glaciihabitans sp. dw_435]